MFSKIPYNGNKDVELFMFLRVLTIFDMFKN